VILHIVKEVMDKARRTGLWLWPINFVCSHQRVMMATVQLSEWWLKRFLIWNPLLRCSGMASSSCSATAPVLLA